ncbi:YceI family protein [Lysobacter sp. A3-1-A15]|uniref:YceI family protein n=1 Tax=Novilysobacter viscosus TaxID=3098602 RepID=UPI002ED90F89
MRPVRRPVPLLVLAALAASSAGAGELEAYAIDPVHTRVMFAVGHAGFSDALGTVSGSTGALLFDPDDWGRTRLDVRVPMAAIDLGDDAWNRATLARNLLDAERHPEARFVSSEVTAVDADSARACGELTLRGVARPLCMDVTLNALKRHPLPPFRRTAGFSATATLSRADYGINAWTSVIGDEVQLRIEAEATRDDDALSVFGPEPAPSRPGLPPHGDGEGDDGADGEGGDEGPDASHTPPDPGMRTQ